MQAGLVGDVPCASRAAVVVGDCFDGSAVSCLFGGEGVAVGDLRTADWFWGGLGVDLEDGVVGAVDFGVDAEAEEMLMVVCVDAGVDLGAPAFGVFVRVHGVGVQDTREFDFELDRAVKMERPVDAVFVVGGREDVGDYEAPAASHDYGVVTVVGVFEENAGVLFVDTNCVGDCLGGAGFVDEVGILGHSGQSRSFRI